jgi:hypothetical protein
MIGVRSLAEEKDFSSSLCVQSSCEAYHTPIQWVPGLEACMHLGLAQPKGQVTQIIFGFRYIWVAQIIFRFRLISNFMKCCDTQTVTTAWLVLGLRIEETASRYGG